MNVAGTAADYRRREGVFVTVRGFGPEFNRVLYNHRRLPNASINDVFSLDAISSALFKESEVYKTTVSNLLSGGIGATINFKNSIDSNQVGHTGELLYTSSKLGEASISPTISWSHQYVGGDWSYLLSAEYSEQKYQIESAFVNGWFAADLSSVPSKAGSSSYEEIWAPRNYDQRIEEGNRHRKGVSLMLDYHGIKDFSLIVDALYSDLMVDSDILSSGNWTHIIGSNQTASQNLNFQSITVDQNDTLLSYQYVQEESFASDFVQLTLDRPSNLKQIGVK